MYLIFHPVSIVRTFTNYHVKFAWKFPAHNWLIFFARRNPWQKIDVSVPANAEHESLQRLLSHQRISINTPYTCITNNTFWFPISNNHLMFNIHNASFRFNKNWISPDDTRFAICFWFYCWSARGIPCLQQKMQWLILFLLLSNKCVLWVS